MLGIALLATDFQTDTVEKKNKKFIIVFRRVVLEENTKFIIVFGDFLDKTRRK